MSARKLGPLGAISALFVTSLGLVIAVLSLLGSAVQLVAGTVQLGAAGLQALSVKLRTRAPSAPPPSLMPPPNPMPPPNRIVMSAPSPAPSAPALPAPEPPITGALLHLGFKPAEVRRFVGSLGPRARIEPLQDLIKEGLRALAS